MTATTTSTAARDTARVHLLLQVDPGRAGPVADAVGALPQVVEAAQTSGPFDVIAVVHGDDLPQALARVRRIPGLCALRICRST